MPLLSSPLAGSPCGCGSSDSSSGTPAAITLVAYDSFPPEKTTLNEALDEFTETTGIAVKIVVAGDAGTMVTKATLTAGNPEGDVMWGVDNTLLSAALDGKVFDPYQPNDCDAIATDLAALVPGHELTPVDFGDVCVNYDIGWFTTHDIDPPTTLDDLLKPEYKDLLVVENPATSSPGLAFLLATIAHARRGRLAGLLDGAARPTASRSSTAGRPPTTRSSAVRRGRPATRPLVVSYGSSPPAEVIFADPPRTDAPTAVIESTCFRQVEFAGVLRGTKHETEARKLVDFLISPRFQNELPLNLFVYPARVRCRRCRSSSPSSLSSRRTTLTHRPGRHRRTTESSGRTSGPASCCAESAAAAGSWLLLAGAPLLFSLSSTSGRWRRCSWTTLSRQRARLAVRGIGGIVWFTAWQAVVSTVLTLVVGILPAYVLARYSFRGRRMLMAATTVPFVLPTVVVGAAFLALLPDGWHGTAQAMILAHVFFNVAVVVRLVGSMIAVIPHDLIERGAHARRFADAGGTARHAADPSARAVVRCRGDLPVQLHVVRRRQAARWADTPDAGGGDRPASHTTR